MPRPVLRIPIVVGLLALLAALALFADCMPWWRPVCARGYQQIAVFSLLGGLALLAAALAPWPRRDDAAFDPASPQGRSIVVIIMWALAVTPFALLMSPFWRHYLLFTMTLFIALPAAAWLLLAPWDDLRGIRWLRRIILWTAPLALFFTGKMLLEAISAHGMRVLWHGLGLLWIWWAVVVAYALLFRGANAPRVALASAGVLLLSAAAGPLSIRQVNAHFHENRILEILRTAGALDAHGRVRQAGAEVSGKAHEKLADSLWMLEKLAALERIAPLFAGMKEGPFDFARRYSFPRRGAVVRGFLTGRIGVDYWGEKSMLLPPSVVGGKTLHGEFSVSAPGAGQLASGGGNGWKIWEDAKGGMLRIAHGGRQWQWPVNALLLKALEQRGAAGKRLGIQNRPLLSVSSPAGDILLLIPAISGELCRAPVIVPTSPHQSLRARHGCQGLTSMRLWIISP